MNDFIARGKLSVISYLHHFISILLLFLIHKEPVVNGDNIVFISNVGHMFYPLLSSLMLIYFESILLMVDFEYFSCNYK